MELLDIVDEQGNFTGQVMEREKAHDLNLLHWEVGVFIVNDKNEILLQKRSPNKRFSPNKWAPCAGHVISGETQDSTAIREVEEELGIKLSPGDLRILEEREVLKLESHSRLTRMYYVIYNGNDFTIQTEELSEVKWFNIDELMKKMKNNDETLAIKSNRLYLLERLKDILHMYAS